MSNKVIYSYCENYNSENTDNSIDFILNNSPELKNKIASAKKILVKPNLLAPRSPEKAVTTHPQLLISLINKIKAPDKEIYLMDTPAGPLNAKILEKLVSACQLNLVEEATGIGLSGDLTEYQVNFPEAKYLKNFKLLNIAQEADLIINFAKLKTHCFTRITCAVKNQYGLIPGLLKMQYHLSLSRPELFNNMLLDLNSYLADKSFHFIDGVYGMEGFGPSNGSPVHAKCLIASESAAYLDVLACHIMGIDPNKIYTLSEALKRNIIEHNNVNSLNIIKDHDILTYRFKLPPDRNQSIPFLPQSFIERLNSFFVPKPVINKDKCIACRECVQMCPPQVMKILDKKARVENYTNCIRCYCCQEVCPHDAIELSNPIGRKLMKL